VRLGALHVSKASRRTHPLPLGVSLGKLTLPSSI
jgi:hypothetical protein